MSLIQKYKTIIIYVLLCLSVIALYSQAIEFDYIWDDYFLIEDNYAIKFGDLSQIVQPILSDTTYFRPLVMFSFILDNLISHNPWIGHIINIIFLFLNACLIFNISFIVGNKLKLNNINYRAFFAAFIYVIHPAIVETTVWLSGRFDVFATFFVLMSLVIFLTEKLSNTIKNILIPILFLLGLLSKELVIVLPALLFIAYFALVSKEAFFSAIPDYICSFKILNLCIILVFIAYFIARLKFMGGAYHTGSDIYSEIKDVNLWWLLLPIDTFYFYVERCFIPFQQMSPLHLGSKETLIESKIYFKALFFICFIILILWGVIKKNVPTLFLLMSFISLFLVLNFIPITIGGNIGHDRFMTLPLSFLLIAFANIHIHIEFKSIFKIFCLASIFIYLFILATVTYSYTAKWKNEVELWRYTNHLYNGLQETSTRYVRGLVLYNKYDELAKYLEDRSQYSKQWDFVDAINLGEYLIAIKDPYALEVLKNVYLQAYSQLKKIKNDRNASGIKQNLFETTSALSRAEVVFSNNEQKAVFYINEAEKYKPNSLSTKFLKQAILVKYNQSYDLQELNNLSLFLSDSYRERILKANKTIFEGLCLDKRIFKRCK